MWNRAKALGFVTRDELADAAGISRRTVQGLMNGSSPHPPAPRTLAALEIALACERGSIVRAFQNADPAPIAGQSLDGPVDPGAWLLRQLHTRGAPTDPDLLRTMGRLLAGYMPEAARVLDVVAGVADTGITADAVTAELPAPAGDDNAKVRSGAARSRRRRAVTAAANQQLTLAAPA